MKIDFEIHDHEAEYSFGVFQGYIQEAINQPTLIVLYAAVRQMLPEEELESLIGKLVTVKLEDGVDGQLAVNRYDGVIYELNQPNPILDDAEKYMYKFVIRPLVWKLNVSSTAASYPNRSKVEIIEEILQKYELEKSVHYETRFVNQSDYPKLPQILQCEMSDWDFIQLLMQETGINFSFHAPKDGESEEILLLSDDNAFFQQEVQNPIKWEPSGNLGAQRHIEAFETKVRYVPGVVKATAALGDGRTKVFQSSVSLDKGKGGTFNVFGAEGEEEIAAAHVAKNTADAFDANRVTYEGKSNYFLIRAGEKIEVQCRKLGVEKKVLVTSVKHFFEMGFDHGLGKQKDVTYSNEFTAVRELADVRPSHNMRAINAEFGNQHPMQNPVFGAKNNPGEQQGASFLDADFLSSIDHLSRSSHSMGIMLGYVEEDTRVTPGTEMTCRISNERFPKGLVAKVSTAWLVPGGGVTALPRAGMQVYFVIVQGNGGQNEAVVVGYRPSKDVPGQDPEKSSSITTVVLADSEDEIVKSDDISPSHRQRVGIRGENATSEMTILDDEGSVSVHATNDVLLVSDAKTRMFSSDYIHLSGAVAEQFATVNRLITSDKKEKIVGNSSTKVKKNQNVSVTQNQHTTVGNNIVMHSEKGDIHIKNDVEKSICLDNGEENKFGLMEDKQIFMACGEDEVVQLDKGKMAMMKSGTEAKIQVGKNAISIVSDTIKIELGGSDITIDSGGITVNSESKVSVVGSGEVSVDAQKVVVTGSTIELN